MRLIECCDLLYFCLFFHFSSWVYLIYYHSVQSWRDNFIVVFCDTTRTVSIYILQLYVCHKCGGYYVTHYYNSVHYLMAIGHSIRIIPLTTSSWTVWYFFRAPKSICISAMKYRLNNYPKYHIVQLRTDAKSQCYGGIRLFTQ